MSCQYSSSSQVYRSLKDICSCRLPSVGVSVNQRVSALLWGSSSLCWSLVGTTVFCTSSETDYFRELASGPRAASAEFVSGSGGLLKSYRVRLDRARCSSCSRSELRRFGACRKPRGTRTRRDLLCRRSRCNLITR